MAYRYGHPATAFNGIWGWLQGRDFFKPLSKDGNGMKNCIIIMMAFMQHKKIRIIYNGRYLGKKPQPITRVNHAINANKIQPYFTEFKQFVTENYEQTTITN